MFEMLVLCAAISITVEFTTGQIHIMEVVSVCFILIILSVIGICCHSICLKNKSDDDDNGYSAMLLEETNYSNRHLNTLEESNLQNNGVPASKTMLRHQYVPPTVDRITTTACNSQKH